MLINTNDYSDFVKIVKNINGPGTMFYYFGGGVNFKAVAVTNDAASAVRFNYDGPTTPKPDTFDADFPCAIALTDAILIRDD